jgi:hypothetical protein
VLGVVASRSGHRVVTFNNKALHSRYDPVREARRFADRSLTDVSHDTIVILLGAAGGYVTNALVDDPRVVRAIPVFLDADMAASAVDGRTREHMWHPRMGHDLYTHLRRALDESDLGRLHLLEWEPAADAFPETAAFCRGQVRQVIGEMKANYVTTCATGRLWVRNAFVNFTRMPATLISAEPEPARPLVIAASGPSLERSITHIKRHREACDLWALPSAVEALLFAGLDPDLVVATDAGYDATRHLDSIHHKKLPVAMPLSAARGAWRFASSVLPVAQPYVFEKALWGALPGLMPYAVSPQGTVAATAYRLAETVGYRCIIFAGLDFCYQDVLSHARPGLFEKAFFADADRLRPGHGGTVAFALERAPQRKGPLRIAGDLSAYNKWFATRAGGATMTFSLDPPTKDGPFRAITVGELRSVLASTSGTRDWQRRLLHRRLPDQSERKAILMGVVEGWVDKINSTIATGGGPDTWGPDVSELCLFCNLAALTRLKAGRNELGENAAPLLDTADFLRAMAGRLAGTQC